MQTLTSPRPRKSDRENAAATILLYHRVADLDFDPQLLSVSPSNFEQHLAALTSQYVPLSMPDFLERRARGAVPERCVVLTFDDGYEDNFCNALPLLTKWQVPATIFVTTGYVNAEREFWWDELEHLIFRAANLPREIRVASDQPPLHLGARPTREDACNSMVPTDWDVTRQNDPTPRHALYRALFSNLRPMDHASRVDFLDRLREFTALTPRVRPTHRPLTVHQLRLLEKSEFIEIGAHTITHPVLGLLDSRRQEIEIRECRTVLEQSLSSEVTGFSYPFGTRHDYAPETVRIVEQAGFGYACANYCDDVRDACDRYQLPRMLVRNWTADELVSRLVKVNARA